MTAADDPTAPDVSSIVERFRRQADAKDLPRWARFAAATVGLILITFGVIAIFRQDSPELGGTALVITGTVLCIVAMIGRLPSRVSAGQVELEFSKDQLDEFLEFVRVEAPGAFVAISALFEAASTDKTSRDVVKSSARGAASAAPSGAPTATAAPTNTAAPKTPTATTSESKPTSVASYVARTYEVFGKLPGFAAPSSVPSSAQGQPPTVNAVARVNDKLVTAEIKDGWNNSIARSVAQRFNRIILSSKEPAVPVLIVPRESVDAAGAAMPGQVLVLALEDVDSLADKLKRATQASTS